jgi:Gram-negative bacterial TonB protein C-terminal
MTPRIWLLILVFASGPICRAQDKGSCPPLPPPPDVSALKKVVPPPPPTPDLKYFGTVTLLTVISDKGYVCSTQVLRGIGKEIDKKTEATVRQWHFDPARKKNGRTVPVIKTVEVNYWATSTGEISSDPPHAPSPVQPGEMRKKD